MKQKGMAILLAALLAVGTAAPVYAAEEIFSIEAVYVGESQKNSPPPAPRPYHAEGRKRSTVSNFGTAQKEDTGCGEEKRNRSPDFTRGTERR